MVGGLLVVLAFAGGYAISVCKTVTLTVDGVAMQVKTMKSRVIDVVEENGFVIDDRDDLYPAADVAVHDAGKIVLRRSRPLQISLDGHDTKQVWTTASTVDEALAQLAMTDTAPPRPTAVAASRWPGWRCPSSARRRSASTTAAPCARYIWRPRTSPACSAPPARRCSRATRWCPPRRRPSSTEWKSR
ncbi:hypothetical protein I548_3849 [Mycobacterium intracellulare]|nr:hypothetical protein I548_3849 [Mycobacterium intracellulare]